MKRITLTITLLVDVEDDYSASKIADEFQEAVASRVIGDGFTNSDVELDEWDFNSEISDVAYNHVLSLAFSLKSNTEDASDVTSEMIKEALRNRIKDLDAVREWEEAVLPPSDTCCDDPPPILTRKRT